MNQPIGGNRLHPEPVLNDGCVVAFALGDTWSDLQAAARIAGVMLGQSAQHLQVLVGTARARVAAITGHLSLSMVQLYTNSADQERLATAAVARLSVKKSPD